MSFIWRVTSTQRVPIFTNDLTIEAHLISPALIPPWVRSELNACGVLKRWRFKDSTHSPAQSKYVAIIAVIIHIYSWNFKIVKCALKATCTWCWESLEHCLKLWRFCQWLFQYLALTIRFITSFWFDSNQNMLFSKVLGIVKNRIELNIHTMLGTW